jgi:hypothetical protein
MHPLLDWFALPRSYRQGDKTFYNAWHRGVDIIVPTGTPGYAFADGQIVLSRDNDPYKPGKEGGEGGKMIYFKADKDGTLHRYLHLSMAHPVGRVKKGDLIFRTGNTGKSTGSHLHTDISANGRLELNNKANFIDPDKYFMAHDILKVQLAGQAPDIKWQTITDFFEGKIKFVNDTPSNILCEFQYRSERGGTAFSWKEYRQFGFWKVAIYTSSKGQYTYEDIIIHELLHIFYYVANLGDIHYYTSPEFPRGWGVVNNQIVFEFIKKRIESKKEPSVRYVIDNNGDQYILLEDYKVAIAIADEQELSVLQSEPHNLGSSPEAITTLPKAYLRYPGFDLSRWADILNLKLK